MIPSPLLFNIIPLVLANVIMQEKEIRDRKITKEIKLSLYADHMITYLENTRKSTETLLQTNKKFSKLEGGKLIYKKFHIYNQY